MYVQEYTVMYLYMYYMYNVHSVDMFVKTRAMSCYKFGPL